MKSSLVETFHDNTSADEARRCGVAAPFWTVRHDFVLQRANTRAPA